MSVGECCLRKLLQDRLAQRFSAGAKHNFVYWTRTFFFPSRLCLPDMLMRTVLLIIKQAKRFTYMSGV